MNRSALGLTAAALLVTGVVFMLVPSLDFTLGGVLLRASLVLGAVWLVLPNARRVPIPMWVGIGVFASVLILRPRLVIWGAAAAMFGSLLSVLANRRMSKTR